MIIFVYSQRPTLQEVRIVKRSYGSLFCPFGQWEPFLLYRGYCENRPSGLSSPGKPKSGGFGK